MQTKTQSFIESTANIVIGLIIAISITQLYDYFSSEVTLPLIENVYLTIILTVVSLIRTYLCRRYFNTKEKR